MASTYLPEVPKQLVILENICNTDFGYDKLLFCPLHQLVFYPSISLVCLVGFLAFATKLRFDIAKQPLGIASHMILLSDFFKSSEVNFDIRFGKEKCTFTLCVFIFFASHSFTYVLLENTSDEFWATSSLFRFYFVKILSVASSFVACLSVWCN